MDFKIWPSPTIKRQFQQSYRQISQRKLSDPYPPSKQPKHHPDYWTATSTGLFTRRRSHNRFPTVKSIRIPIEATQQTIPKIWRSAWSQKTGISINTSPTNSVCHRNKLAIPEFCPHDFSPTFHHCVILHPELETDCITATFPSIYTPRGHG